MKTIPGVLEKTKLAIQTKVAKLYEMGIQNVQLDICDGFYTKEPTWPYSTESGEEDVIQIAEGEDGLPYWQDISYELDLMVRDASKNFALFTSLGAGRLTFHLDAEIGEEESDFADFLAGIDRDTKENIEIGLAILPTTEIKDLEKFMSNIDYVQCMGIDEVGAQGKAFDQKIIGKVRELREKYPDLEIQVDGGVSLENAKLLKEAGADRIIVGSAIWKSQNIIETIEEFESI